MIYQYTQRYFADENNLSPSNVQNVINMVEADFKKIEPYINTVQMPSIVQKNKKVDAGYSNIIIALFNVCYQN